MKIGKKLFKNEYVQNVFCWIAYFYIWFVYITSRWEVRGFDEIDKLTKAGKPFIIAFWHGRLLMIPPFPPKGKKIHVLISTHTDGELIAKVMKHFHFGLIRGSSKKDGISAFKNILKTLKRGEIVAITPDGPKGPRMRIGGHIIKIAQMTSVPIIPMTFSISKCKVLRSWDRFILAKPFGKGAFIYGKPMLINKEYNDDELKKAGIELENQLNNINMKADEIVGIVPVKPDDGTQKKKEF